MSLVTCPSAADLERLFLGGLPEPEVEVLEQHVWNVARCLERLNKLFGSQDTLPGRSARGNRQRRRRFQPGGRRPDQPTEIPASGVRPLRLEEPHDRVHLFGVSEEAVGQGRTGRQEGQMSRLRPGDRRPCRGCRRSWSRRHANRAAPGSGLFAPRRPDAPVEARRRQAAHQSVVEQSRRHPGRRRQGRREKTPA